ncbi:MAG TPA: hypothetical protein VFX16_30820 [Pseudonocardiaceae bacterium]|nr:hypothetical protein [Pseudonocardiaceae bacterium]
MGLVGGAGNYASVRLGVVCEGLANPGMPAWVRELAEPVLAMVRAGTDPTVRDWQDLVTAVRDAESRFQKDRIYQGLPTDGGGHAQLDVLVCPRGRCARVEAPPASGDDPVCSVFAEHPHRQRLS